MTKKDFTKNKKFKILYSSNLNYKTYLNNKISIKVMDNLIKAYHL